MKVYAWLIDFAHGRKNGPTGIIPEWMQKVTQHSGVMQYSNADVFCKGSLFQNIYCSWYSNNSMLKSSTKDVRWLETVAGHTGIRPEQSVFFGTHSSPWDRPWSKPITVSSQRASFAYDLSIDWLIDEKLTLTWNVGRFCIRSVLFPKKRVRKLSSPRRRTLLDEKNVSRCRFWMHLFL